MYRKERPACRKALERLLKDERTTLEEMLARRSQRGGKIPFLSDGMRIQAKKMISERGKIKTKPEWEEVNSYSNDKGIGIRANSTDRLKVEGGYIYRSQSEHRHDDCHISLCESMCFVPEPET